MTMRRDATRFLIPACAPSAAVIFACLFTAPIYVSAHSRLPYPLAFVSCPLHRPPESSSVALRAIPTSPVPAEDASRRKLLSSPLVAAAAGIAAFVVPPEPVLAIGPVRIDMTAMDYSAEACPKDRPIPGEKAMKGMRGLCVTVNANLKEPAPVALEAIGVYGFVTYGETRESVLANNPDLSTDAGQFTIIPAIEKGQKTVTFDFVAALAKEISITGYDNGIGPLVFESLRVISYPGGQQYGAVGPCEFNEFSSECDDWEEINGKYTKGNFMVKSNSRTKGR
mmetsp:Transcript_40710/g.79663  ORF Transcript_40710/g.79663 Transcript_40710/m.79663 type:complete len:282 (-) Transcript_40710:304-1149(-)|eukprot:CAMPEP_0194325220 /NCGR_PEP_ID=MMETSP0171-20130528/29112_1 /TAXON_ID=218684 /ORGANISM="Corethron pennatum, Strain L29A3" /LENGTH=281 /DNA_ID=CAMNT_0039084269 /DNA_START=15 /DNA_END=860 /DNA_ORIENTATION=-